MNKSDIFPHTLGQQISDNLDKCPWVLVGAQGVAPRGKPLIDALRNVMLTAPFGTWAQRCNALSRVACIRDSLEVRGISPRVANYVLKSWRPGTEKSSSSRSSDSL